MNDAANHFDQIVNQRRSIRVYDTEANYDPDIVKRSLERAVLSPNSSNMQVWEFYRVRNTEKRKLLAEACLNQSAARTAQELIVVAVRRDKWKQRAAFNLGKVKEQVGPNPNEREQMAIDYYQKLIPLVYSHDRLGILGLMKNIFAFGAGFFRAVPRENGRSDARISAHKSAALAAMTFMYSIKAEGLDSCPLEGFDSWKVKKVVGLPSAAEVNMVISVGAGSPEGLYNPRWRVDNSEVIFEI